MNDDVDNYFWIENRDIRENEYIRFVNDNLDAVLDSKK